MALQSLDGGEKESSDFGDDGIVSSNDPLLAQDETMHSSSRARGRRRWVALLMGHCALLLVNMILFTIWASDAWRGLRIHETTMSPAVEAIEYESLYFKVLKTQTLESKFVGEPREELDEAWHKLLENTNVAVPAETMRDLGVLDESILLPDGSGYLAMIFAYHQLHCIKRLHHYMYEDHYLPNLTASEKVDNRMHNHHCLDVLRQSVMCNGDVSLIPLRWGHNQRMPLGNFSATHFCRKWDAIDQWAGEHSPKRLMEPGWLVNPTFGAVIDPANRHKQKLGVAHDQ